jgi:hypothetical protein
MGKRFGNWIVIALAGVFPSVALSQSPLTLQDGTSVAPALENQVGGLPAADLILLSSVGPGAPLKHGNIVPGSEFVSLNGAPLTAGRDYSIDYASGVVYLMRAQKQGDSLSVSYRYNSSAAAASKQLTQFAGLAAFKYNLLPGDAFSGNLSSGSGLSILGGFGLTDRQENGTIQQSNLFGFNNSFSFGQSSMSGLYIVGNKRNAEGQSQLNFDSSSPGSSAATSAPGTDAGDTKLIVQNISSKLAGGTAHFDYQDISKNFTGFSAVQGNGYDDAAISRLKSERGLTRYGFGLDILKVGSLGFSDGYRTVGDEQGGVTWRSFGLTNGGLNVHWTSQKVDQNFSRFKDISEADHDQIGKELGLSRQNWSGSFAQKMGKMSFTSSEIADGSTTSRVKRDEFALDTSAIKFNIGQQDVDAKFSRFQSLLAPEQSLYGREAGLHRQWIGLDTALMGKNSRLTWSQSLVASSTGDLTSRDVALQGKTWSLVHADRNLEAGFASLSSLPDAEQDGHVKAIAAMYSDNVATTPADRAGFASSLGVKRDYSAVSAEPFKKWKVGFSQLNLKGRQGTGFN